MMLPFLKRHIELVKPDVLVAMGNISCQSLIGRRGSPRSEVFGLRHLDFRSAHVASCLLIT